VTRPQSANRHARQTDDPLIWAQEPSEIEAPLHAWSYRAVERQSNRIANALIARGLGPEEAVAVCCEDRARAAVALLGVVKAGAWFVPIDPDLPPARIGSILSDAGCRVALVGQRQQALVAAASLAAVAPPAVLVLDDAVDADWLAVADARHDPAARGLAPAHLAYGIYTSGSTGQPKGVACFHRALCTRVAARIARRFGIVFRIGDVFEAPTLSAMAALAASRAETRDVPELTTEFVFELPPERDR